MMKLSLNPILYFYLSLLLIISACTPTPPSSISQTIVPTPIRQTIALNPVVTAKKSAAVLKLDTFGHTALIRDILIDKEKNIISASKDKTIRIWDSQTGKEKRKILGKVGAGNEGKIYAIALSANNRYLAVGGYFDNTTAKANKKHGQIRIYDYPSGRLLRVLKSHRGVVIDLAFSPDNRYLLSGSADTSVKVWDTQSWTLKDTLNTHSNHVHAVLMLNNPQRGYDIYSAADDNTVALHHFQHKTLLVKQFTAKYKLRYLATNGKHVAVSGKGKQIFIFNRQLKLQQTLNSDTQPRGLVYSPDGQTLMAGFSFDRRKLTDVVNLYRLPDYRKTISFKQHPNLTRSVAFLDNNTAVTGGGNNNEIFIWDKNTAAVKRKIVGTGQRILSVGIQDDALAWGNQSNYINQNDRGKLQNSFNLTNFQFQTNPKNYQRISTQQNGYSLNHSRGGNYGYADAILNIQQQGKTIAKITRDTTTGIRHRSYGWYNGFIISGGANGFLAVYNRKGQEVTSLIGHTGDVWSIAVDKNRLVSGGDDQTMKLWDLSVLQQANPPTKIYPLLNIFIAKNNEFVVWTKEGFFNASKNGAQYIGYHLNQGTNKEAFFVPVTKLYKTFHRPDLIKKALKGEDLSPYTRNISINKLLLENR